MMGWRNPPVSWSELERRLSTWSGNGGSGRPSPTAATARRGPGTGRARAPAGRPGAGSVPYAELHCHSNFSFLDGASHPEELAEEAVRLGLSALALTDHDGFYGVVRFAEAAGALGLPTVFGSEVALDVTAPRAGAAGVPDPSGTHPLILARDPIGYARLAATVSRAQLAGRRPAPGARWPI